MGNSPVANEVENKTSGALIEGVDLGRRELAIVVREEDGRPWKRAKESP